MRNDFSLVSDDGQFGPVLFDFVSGIVRLGPLASCKAGPQSPALLLDEWGRSRGLLNHEIVFGKNPADVVGAMW